MKNISLIIGLIICSLWITSCTDPSTETIKETPTNNAEQINSDINSAVTASPQATPTKEVSPSESPETSKTVLPTIGTVKELVNGDLLCYATLTDEQGIEHQVGASFEICAESAKLLNKKVRASYTVESVSDCQSAEPCGKTKKESIITKMEVLSQ